MKRKVITTTLPPDIYKSVKLLGLATNLPANRIIEKALEKYLSNKDITKLLKYKGEQKDE